MNEIIEELSKYSQKELESILNKPSAFSSKYVIEGNTLKKIDGKDCYGRFYISGNRYRPEEVKEYLKPLTTKKFAEVKLNNITEKINDWSYERFYEYCLKQFISAYGEQYVDDECPYITVHFPEITVSNSIEQSHIIRDVYLKFEIRSNGVKLYGLKRGTVTETEWRNNYWFSHCDSYRVSEWTRSFCFGYTDIADIKEKLAERNKLYVFKHLSYFLEAIKEYLSWESLEGVPYYKIDSVINDVTRFQEKSINISNVPIEEMYNSCIRNITSLKYSYYQNDNNEYVIRLEDSSNIAEHLTQAFPEHCYYFLNGDSVEEKTNPPQCTYQNDRHIIFKGEHRPFNLIKDTPMEISLPKRIHSRILNKIVEKIQNNLENFILNKKLNEITGNR